MPFSDDVRARLDAGAAEIIAKYPRPRSALLPVLHLVQSEEGFVSADGIEYCAATFGLTEAEVTAVVSFYTMYKRRPIGDYHVGVCTNTLCAVMGGDQIFAELTEYLGVGNDETTPDGKILLEHVECNAACDYAPVVMVNWEFFDNMTPAVGPPARRRPAGGKLGPPDPRPKSAVHLARDVPDPGGLQRRPGHRGPDRGPGQPGRPQDRQRARLDRSRPGRRLRRFRSARRSGRLGRFRAARIRRLAGGRRQPQAGPVSRAGRGSGGGPVTPAAAGHVLRQGAAVTDMLTPVLTAGWDQPDLFTIDGYKQSGGWRALPKALAMPPDDVIAMVKDSGLRGRGGAGFPTGVKWSFLPQGDAKPHYLVVNADESEPGTCKDVPLMMANPHVLVEGAAIAAYAIRATHAFIYVRGEVTHVVRRLRHAVEEAYAAGYLGADILGSGFDLDIIVHAGAGAYICGEESALLTSLEGYRGLPRLRPPFPAVAGLYACPTDINNVESIASVPSIVVNGADWFAGLGTEKSKGFGIFNLSGHVTTPGAYEAPLGITLRELLDLAGGMRAGHRLKFWTPGGSSTPLLTDEHLDVPLDFESVAAAGSMLGTRALQIFDETTCVVRAVLRWTEFYEHESCGKCTPCREGTFWMVKVLERLEHGHGTEEDLEKLLDICDNILGRAFCALGDGATSPITSGIQYFRDEFMQHQKEGGCPFDPAASTLFGENS